MLERDRYGVLLLGFSQFADAGGVPDVDTTIANRTNQFRYSLKQNVAGLTNNFFWYPEQLGRFLHTLFRYHRLLHSCDRRD